MISLRASPRVRDNRVCFYFQQPDARSVTVLGTFNNWDKSATPLTRRDDGWWISEEFEASAPARHQYRFWVNNEYYSEDPITLNKERSEKNKWVNYFDTWVDVPGMREQLDGVHKTLEVNPPGKGNLWLREMCAHLVDDYLQMPNVNRSSTIETFYLQRLEKCVSDIEQAQVHQGIFVWHIYNMGYVFKTPSACFGIDVVTGHHGWNLAWNVPDALVKRLADAMDFMLVTHEHSDHSDPQIMERMIERHKPVYVPRRYGFMPADVIELTRPDVFTVKGQQIRPHKGRHVYDNGRNIPIFLYEIFTDSGVCVLHSGDHDYSEYMEWHRTPDILIPKYGGVTPHRSNRDVLDILFDYGETGLILPAHINELGHYPGGGRTSYRGALDEFTACRHPYQLLLWGEGYHFT